jgi:alkanesulfonate monooxygenase SsuD/methylene tetrahydromethanopterin reductase-like flavin-dependent oxidoreductase (luciferase family)
MKFGLSLPNHGEYGDIQRMIELACLAEEFGWDGFFMWDHFARTDEPMIDPWIAMSAIAVQTRTMRLGLHITPLSRRRPWKVAREIVTLDHLSNGRMVLGVGLGDFKGKEFAAFGEVTDNRQRGAMLDEGLEIVNGLQTGEAFQFSGEHYKIAKATFNPQPVQRPRVPVWVAGQWPNKKPFRRAARWDGAVPLFRTAGLKKPPALEVVRACQAYIQAHRTAETPFDFCVSSTLPAKSPSKDHAVVAPYAKAGVTWWVEFVYTATGTLKENTARIRSGPPK